ncbi:TIR domain-containing protein [Actinomyces bowdenii]|uniref:TIR domain-containing protein n=1 Tax=Actinomyces bowdenii TaxID=131109 RepID=UPI00214AEFB8|nr:TIR domain-containing protein [Actinomyces bowdenii]MCR2052859.1 TIR domain-containing protein [Actinomyces bowdenii]
MLTLASKTRHKCFISYHHADEDEVQNFIETFDHNQDVLIARGIGASMSGDIINSQNSDYIMSQIRAKYLRNTTVTIVMIGKNTWGRKFVDWEIAASLRNTVTHSASGLLGITLPSAMDNPFIPLPARLSDNLDTEHEEYGYAYHRDYPFTAEVLAHMIDIAYSARTAKSHLRNNCRPLRQRNA